MNAKQAKANVKVFLAARDQVIIDKERTAELAKKALIKRARSHVGGYLTTIFDEVRKASKQGLTQVSWNLDAFVTHSQDTVSLGAIKADLVNELEELGFGVGASVDSYEDVGAYDTRYKGSTLKVHVSWR